VSIPAVAGVVPVEGDPAHYLNRELSWLEFNARVLAEARAHEVPLFERLKFLSIFFSNLDEFFMVRVAGLQAQTQRTIAEVPPDGLTPYEQLVAISARVHALVDDAYQLWHSDLIPALQRAGIVIVRPDELDATELSALDERFRTDIFPILTPIAIDPGHPFPHLRNKMINLGIMFSREHEAQEPGFAVIQVPPGLSRLMRVRVEGATRAFVLLEDVIARHVKDFFPSGRLRGTYPFRVTRNWDLEIDEEEGEDLLETIQAELRRRDRGNAVRLEIGFGEGAGTSVQRLCRALKVDAAPARNPGAGAPSTGCLGRSTSPTSWASSRTTSAASTATSRSRRRSHRSSGTSRTSSPSSGSRTCSCTTRTSRSIRSPSSSPALPTTRTCSRSSRRSTGPAATPRS
jgi:polyphosphate kinase